MVKKITAFQTSDGKVYGDEDEALRVEARIQFIKTYSSAGSRVGIMSAGGDTICGYELADWLIENKRLVEDLIGVYYAG